MVWDKKQANMSTSIDLNITNVIYICSIIIGGVYVCEPG